MKRKEPEAAKKSGRKKRLLFYAALAAFSFCLSFLPALYGWLDPTKVLPLIERELSRLTGQNVHISGVRVDFDEGVILEATSLFLVVCPLTMLMLALLVPNSRLR